MGKYNNLQIGEHYNNWEIISECTKNKFGKDAYWCRCICGAEHYLDGRAVATGLTKSCGCVNRVDEATQKERQQQYKRDYFQKNKEKIYERVHKRQKERREEDYKKYGMDRYHIKSKYGLSIEDYQELLQKQNSICPICKRTLIDRQNMPHVDHDHTTNKIRGILCGNCNMGLGNFKDNIESLKRAIKYLEENKNG